MTGPIHVLGGRTRILGTVEGDVTQVGGTLVVEETAEIRGTLQHIGGTLTVSPAAEVGRRTSIDVTPEEPGPVRRFLPGVLATGLVAVTFLSLFVFMAFTLVLVPVSLLGLAAGLVAVAYGVVGVGYLVGRRLPIRRAGVATGAGVMLVMVAVQVLGAVPVLGNAVVGGILLAGLGAVLLTYFGLREFTPASLRRLTPVRQQTESSWYEGAGGHP